MNAGQLPNGRDLGGHVTESGRIVRPGVVIRAAAFSQPEHVAEIEELGVHRIFDLRTAEELEFRPGPVQDRAETIHADMLADEPHAGPASLGQIARAAMSGGDMAPMSPEDLRATFVTGYRAFVTLQSARSVSRQILATVADPDSGTTIIHCTAGKDRTGWISALILQSLGVPWETVMADYLESGPAVAAMFAPYRERFAADGGDVAALDVAVGVDPAYLESTRSAMHEQFGSLDLYLSHGLALPPDFRDRLAARMLTDSSAS